MVGTVLDFRAFLTYPDRFIYKNLHQIIVTEAGLRDSTDMFNSSRKVIASELRELSEREKASRHNSKCCSRDAHPQKFRKTTIIFRFIVRARVF